MRIRLWVRDFVKQMPLQMMVLPGIVFMIVFNYIPIYGLKIAFQNYTVVDTLDSARWVGMENFKIILTDKYFWDSVYNTLGISFLKLLFGFVTPIILAVTLITCIIVFPLWNVVVNSFSSATAVASGKSIFWPADFSTANYKAVFSDTSIWNAFLISVLKTLIGVVCHVFFCAMVAYGMSKEFLQGRKLYTVMGVITMFFSGGMIPTYLLIKSLGMLDSFAVYIIPALFSCYDMIILMNFFRQLPQSLEESAKIDGAGYWRIFLTLALPLSKPALATIALFHGVSQWNDFMTAKMYILNEKLYPLQMKLYEIIVQSQMASMQNPTSVEITTTSRGIQLATIVVTTVPILVIYPLLQKHFVSGMMIGAVKE